MLNKKKLVISILARDCEKTLERNISKIETLRKYFLESHIVIIENDSKDKTKDILFNWKSVSKNIHVLSDNFNTNTFPIHNNITQNIACSSYRIVKMAMYRNMYMDYIESLKINFDYLIVIDIDIESFSISGIIDSIISAPENWSALFANGIVTLRILGINIASYYYDVYAFSKYGEKKYIQNDILMYDARQYLFLHTRSNMFIKCNSAFSGIGVYKYDLIKDKKYYCKYNSEKNNIESLCEHISFNFNLSNNYISNRMKVYYNEKFNWKTFILIFIPSRIKKSLIYMYNAILKKQTE